MGLYNNFKTEKDVWIKLYDNIYIYLFNYFGNLMIPKDHKNISGFKWYGIVFLSILVKSKYLLNICLNN